MEYSIFIAPCIFLLATNFAWVNLWNYFAKTYPEQRKQYFPTGSAAMISPRELYNRQTWAIVWPIVRQDSGVMHRIKAIVGFSALFFLAVPIQLIILAAVKQL